MVPLVPDNTPAGIVSEGMEKKKVIGFAVTGRSK